MTLEKVKFCVPGFAELVDTASGNFVNNVSKQTLIRRFYIFLSTVKTTSTNEIYNYANETTQSKTKN